MDRIQSGLAKAVGAYVGQAAYTQRAKDLLSGAAAGLTSYRPLDSKETAWKYFAAAAGVEKTRMFTEPVDEFNCRMLEIGAALKLAVVAMTQCYLSEDWLEEWIRALKLVDPDAFRKEVLAAVGLAKGGRTQLDSEEAEERGGVESSGRFLAGLAEALARQAAVINLVGRSANRLLRDRGRDWLPVETSRTYQIVAIRAEKQWGNPLAMVLDEYLRQVKPSYLGYSREEKLVLARQLLIKHPCLLLIANIESVESDRRPLLDWLASIPHPSKSIVSSAVRLSDKDLPECRTTLHMPEPQVDDEKYRVFLGQLHSRNPSAKLSRGSLERLMQYTDYDDRRALQFALRLQTGGRDIDPARIPQMEMITSQICGGLSDGGKRVLLSLSPFPLRATVLPLRYIAAREEDWAANMTAATQDDDWFGTAIAELIAKGIVTPINDPSGRPTAIEWDQEVHDIATAGLGFVVLQGFYHGHDELMRAWIGAYRALAHAARYCPEDHSKLEVLDAETAVLPKVLEFLHNATDGSYDADALGFAADISYYLYVRGIYARQISSHKVALSAAQRLRARAEHGETVGFPLHDLVSAEVMEMAFELEWLVRREEFAEVSRNDYVTKLDALIDGRDFQPHLSARIVALVSTAYYYMEKRPRDLHSARERLDRAIALGTRAPARTSENSQYDEHRYVTQFTLLAKYRIAQCLGATDPEAAIQYIQSVLGEPTTDLRTMNRLEILLASTALDLYYRTTQREYRVAAERSLRRVGESTASDAGYRDLARFLDQCESGQKPGLSMACDKTEVARLLEVYGRYAFVSDLDGARAYLEVARQFYLELDRPSKVRDVDRILSGAERHSPDLS